MKMSNCPYICFVSLLGDKSDGTCNLYPKEKNRHIQFVPCESIPISKCKFKLSRVNAEVHNASNS